MNPGRTSKLNKFIVIDYFDKLKAVTTCLGIFDKPQLRKGDKRVHRVVPEYGENVSMPSCEYAPGQVIPPTILFKGKRLNPEWKATFITCYVLLIFDGASSHLDAGIVEAANAYGIALFCLPSNTTHELQHFDKSVFGPYERFWDDGMLLYWPRQTDIQNRTISRTFGKIFSRVWAKATTPANVSTGFSTTEIYPFDPTAIHESAYTPSELTRIENTDETPQGSQSADPVFPTAE
ncbi:hypothetical protein PR048_023680 [Dryococelus australis]|uniref:DDE-1 domain-containing protein n=1 Tax=Dryococelus australis TaxID=614101 RepID=A0ABQ9GUU7_9NEOP|nr:hypothetical protein PR048_023680 [Dryococelus australis]